MIGETLTLLDKNINKKYCEIKVRYVMMRVLKNAVLVIYLIVVSMFISCGMNNSKSREREEILNGIMSLQDKLPYNFPGTSLSIIEVAVDNDIVVYKLRIGKEDWDIMSWGSEVANSDRNIARVLSTISDKIVDKFIEHEIGVRYIYISEETDKTLLQIEIPAGKMKEIREMVRNGEIQPYTLKEILKMEIAKMNIPSQIEEGVWITDVFLKENKVYYIATIEENIDSSCFSESNLSEIKSEMLDGLKSDGLFMMHKKEIIREKIHFVYVYKDKSGNEIIQIEITSNDLLL